MLRLAERHPHIGIEVSGYTLEEIARLDPLWIAAARKLIADNRIELIGSGYSQMIGPLVPARVMAENLRIGNDVYHALLGVKPAVALVNEQAFSAGLVEHYLDAGYRALLARDDQAMWAALYAATVTPFTWLDMAHYDTPPRPPMVAMPY